MRTLTAPMPRSSNLLGEHIRWLGLRLRLEMTLFAGSLALLGAALLYSAHAQGTAFEFEPVIGVFVALAAFLMPFAIWKGAAPFEDGYVQTLPVRRPTLLVLKVLAGYVWLILLTAAVLLWLAALILLTSGELLPRQDVLLITSAGVQPGLLQVAAWQWLAPFGAATVAYLVGCAAIIGLGRPVLACAMVVLALVLGSLLARDAVAALLEGLVNGSIGLDYALSAGNGALRTAAQLAGGQQTEVWRGLPSASRWLLGTALWTTVGLLLLAAALVRHREH